MDISNNGPVQPGGIRDQHKVQSLGNAQRRVQESARRQQETDQVVLSDRAQLLQKLDRAVREAPDVREDRVAELRDAIRDGSYQVSPMEIARAILGSRGK